MNKTLNATLTVIAVIALAAVIFFAGSMYTRMNTFGPSMMNGWNNDNVYGPNNMMNGRGQTMMGGNNGMMNGWDSTTPLDVTAELTVTPEQAIEYAQKYLDANNSGAIAASDPIQFYGYYTLDFEKDGRVAGMLSVNGYSGQIFLHTWHGIFIEETEYE